MFMVSRPINGEPATPANGGTIGFKMANPAEADAWRPTLRMLNAAAPLAPIMYGP